MTAKPLLRYETEAEWQSAVVEYARLNGWLVAHVPDSRQMEPGLPDLILARGGHVLLVELKSEKGKVSTERRVTKTRVLPSQKDWLEASGAYLWRPHDWEHVKRTLAKEGA